MAPRFRVLTPDAQYDDAAEVERSTAGPDFHFEILCEREAPRVPEESLAACDALLVWHELPIDAAVIAKRARCRVIARAGVGYDHIDLEAAGAAGIPVCNTPDYGTGEVADHAIALALTLKRGILSYQATLQAEGSAGFDWRRGPHVSRLRGAAFGIVGLGRIGTATALRAKAFGFEVLAYDPYLPSGQEIALGVTRLGSLRDLLAACDVVSLHVPLTAETRGMIDAEALSAMQPEAVLVNTARGAVIDLAALHDALHARHIAAAALDVLPAEPPDPEEPLFRAFTERAEWLEGRLLLTPHAAWYAPESQTDARRLSTETLVGYLARGELRNCVNGEFLTRPAGKAD